MIRTTSLELAVVGEVDLVHPPGRDDEATSTAFVRVDTRSAVDGVPGLGLS